MNLTEFLASVAYERNDSVVKSRDSTDVEGSVVVRLSVELGQRSRDHARCDAHRRLCRYDDEAYLARGLARAVDGYDGRMKSITAIEVVHQGFAEPSDPPPGARSPGSWAKSADLTRSYPYPEVGREEVCGRMSADVFVVLGVPIAVAGVRFVAA